MIVFDDVKHCRKRSAETTTATKTETVATVCLSDFKVHQHSMGHLAPKDSFGSVRHRISVV